MNRKDRIARNETLFREVNERVRELSAEEGEHVGFLCECGVAACTETIYLSTAEYEAVRAEPTHFAVAPGHEVAEVETPINRTERFVVVRKVPSEASTAVESDPRR